MSTTTRPAPDQVSSVPCVNRLLDEAIARGWTNRRAQKLFRLEQQFAGVAMRNRALLDIGGGSGLTTLYAACCGANPAICLEPETAGSQSKITHSFDQLARSLQLDGAAQLLSTTLQEYDPGAQKFDVVLMQASIHHLDEAACRALPGDAGAVQIYLELLEKCRDFMAPGAVLIIRDASRNNLFGRLGKRHPLLPSMDWSLHPPPAVWIDLCRRSGFAQPRLQWLFFERAGLWGQRLFGNPVAAFFGYSGFLLTMRRGD